MSTINALPNFAGELFTADAINTPLLTMTGGLTGGKITQNFEFPTSSEYALPAAVQPAIDENASLAGTPVSQTVARTQVFNTCQIHQERIDLSYVKTSNFQRMSGLNTAGAVNNAPDELAFQQARKLEKIARDVEFSFIQGTYVQAVNSGVAAQTRGIVEVCQLAGGTNVNGLGNQLDLTALQAFFLSMYTAGATFSNLVLYVPGTLKQRISAIYGFAPAARNVGGVNIEQIETDFGNVGIVVSRFAPANTVLAIEVSVVAPVFCPVPNKGTLFYEELAKIGAGEYGQMYGMIGIDHGPAFAHGRLFNVTA